VASRRAFAVAFRADSAAVDVEPGGIGERDQAASCSGEYDGQGGAGGRGKNRGQQANQHEGRQAIIGVDQVAVLEAESRGFERGFENRQPQEKQGKACQSFPQKLVSRVAADQFEAHPGGQQWQRHGFDLEAEANQADQPAGHGGTDVGTENNAQGLGQSHQAGIHKPNGCHGYRPGMLHDTGNNKAGE